LVEPQVARPLTYAQI
jgi:hypothetical protein